MLNVGFKRSAFLLDGGPTSQPEINRDEEQFKAIELKKIALLINGLIELIKEVDKAHTDKHLKDEDKARATEIKRRASQLQSHRKNADPSPTIKYLAEAAGINIPRSIQTIRRYIGR